MIPAGPFAEFDPAHRTANPLRALISAAYCRPEIEALPELIALATQPPETVAWARATARKLVTAIRLKGSNGGVEALVQEYALSSEEGVALMCLAEALLRIPDKGTRDALIRDKISRGSWRSHLGGDRSLFVNAATWGLVVTGRLTTPVKEAGLSSALTRLIARGGEPIIRTGVDVAMRMMGEQFVTGQTIKEALGNARRMEAKGFHYSYDMLGEAAATAEDADRYMESYETAIHAIGKAAKGRGPYGGPGISIKLSALHPRYERTQSARVMAELLPRVKQLAILASDYDIGLNIDAEEARRLEISLDLLEALSFAPELKGWNGLGFVVQAYGKRCPFVIDYLIDLARRSERRLMVRLVKGAYWDSEIKAAQVDGLEDFPVYTRKVHTDVSYLACAKKLLGAPAEIFPQFATHNAQTLATIYQMAGPDFEPGQYEFQCLHGMGEPLYEEVVGKDKLGRPCRIYAPVGSHETLLAYLVRRLLENGANSSFVNQIADGDISIDDLVADPVAKAAAISPVGARHPRIDLPKDILGGRVNSAGLNLSNENDLASVKAGLLASVRDYRVGAGTTPVRNPAQNDDVVGAVAYADAAAIGLAFASAGKAAEGWQALGPAGRAEILLKAADLMQQKLPDWLGLIIREAGKSTGNAIGEVREAIDFLRYYAQQARDGFAADTHLPLGAVVCISPWNFPLSIFTGQVAAALAAGNVVLAKPAEETPLIAAEAVRLLHQAGVPQDVLHYIAGDGPVGAALVGHEACHGVLFTGSVEVARLIQKQLAERLLPDGRPIPLIAETGGQNAMIVDSSALTEQVVADVLSSAFDSAGQRCSALRILCVQDDVADKTLAMLKGGLAELSIGDPARLSTDIGPVITAEARDRIDAHIAAMAARGHKVTQLPLPAIAAQGTFVAPAIIELPAVGELSAEVFGPVLHVVRFARGRIDQLIAEINALGFGLTFGLHTRIDETIRQVTDTIEVGNIYVNRNVIGAVVGVQPFGGHGLSGTGPKAGGPLYLRRLLRTAPALPGWEKASRNAVFDSYRQWLAAEGHLAALKAVECYAGSALDGHAEILRGPVGEDNRYRTEPRGRLLLLPQTPLGLLAQLGAVMASGNAARVSGPAEIVAALQLLPADLAAMVDVAEGEEAYAGIAGVLVEGGPEAVAAVNRRVTALPGPLVLVQGATSAGLADASQHYGLDVLVLEVATSINTAAAGGNASLMTIG
ncbi:MAG TPA: trifunctional transcriptional regulator/proline dehydrogenase/L-glutamate gamma-semialdehyde dehydrogenase [Devosiaceae bacterium]|jgi:RHH-type proline utilization regulon transcriptional repressor/proline dehydrogenase/delta 1-pyrroline-5-carboxylate dehydrogenase